MDSKDKIRFVAFGQKVLKSDYSPRLKEAFVLLCQKMADLTRPTTTNFEIACYDVAEAAHVVDRRVSSCLTYSERQEVRGLLPTFLRELRTGNTARQLQICQAVQAETTRIWSTHQTAVLKPIAKAMPRQVMH